jgi:hypothetical protein
MTGFDYSTAVGLIFRFNLSIIGVFVHIRLI